MPLQQTLEERRPFLRERLLQDRPGHAVKLDDQEATAARLRGRSETHAPHQAVYKVL